MKQYNTDWQQFIYMMPAWSALSAVERRVFLDRIDSSGATEVEILHGHASALVKAGFVRYSHNGKGVTLLKEFRRFRRALLAMDWNRILETPDIGSLYTYFSETFSNEERRNFYGDHNYYTEYDRETAHRLASVDWLDRFLEADPCEWERFLLTFHEENHFKREEVDQALKVLLTELKKRTAPVTIVEIPNWLPETSREDIGHAILAGIRFGLLFPSLRSVDLIPIVGIWPGITERLFRKPVPPPKTVKARETFGYPFCVDDMATLLVACSSDNVRLRGNDCILFAKVQREILADLISLPEWVEETLGAKPVYRLNYTVLLLFYMNLIERKGKGGKDLRLSTTRDGMNWLELPPKERIKRALDFLREYVSIPPKKYTYEWDWLELFPEQAYDYAPDDGWTILYAPAIKALSGIPTDGFIGIREFFKYNVLEKNPLIQMTSKKRNRKLWKWSEPTIEGKEQIWRIYLGNYLKHCLFAFGGVEVGKQRNEEYCFKLTDLGLYFLGKIKNFKYEARSTGEIVVQPNFDIVFLSADPSAEAAIARFAERNGKGRGNGLGHLFTITKKSIHKAAESGHGPEDVLDALGSLCSKDVPKNVAFEIRSWFKQFCQVKVRTALLIECPDEETADKVLSSAGAKVHRLSQQTLEIVQPKQRATILRKLRGAGIFTKT